MGVTFHKVNQSRCEKRAELQQKQKFWSWMFPGQIGVPQKVLASSWAKQRPLRHWGEAQRWRGVKHLERGSTYGCLINSDDAMNISFLIERRAANTGCAMPFMKSNLPFPKPSVLKAAPQARSGSGRGRRTPRSCGSHLGALIHGAFSPLSDPPPHDPTSPHLPSVHPSLPVFSAVTSPLLRKPVLAHDRRPPGVSFGPPVAQ